MVDTISYKTLKTGQNYLKIFANIKVRLHSKKTKLHVTWINIVFTQFFHRGSLFWTTLHLLITFFGPLWPPFGPPSRYFYRLVLASRPVEMFLSTSASSKSEKPHQRWCGAMKGAPLRSIEHCCSTRSVWKVTGVVSQSIYFNSK